MSDAAERPRRPAAAAAPLASSSFSDQSEVTRFLGLLISARLATAAAVGATPGFRRLPPGGRVGGFARHRQQQGCQEYLAALVSFLGLQQGVA